MPVLLVLDITIKVTLSHGRVRSPHIILVTKGPIRLRCGHLVLARCKGSAHVDLGLLLHHVVADKNDEYEANNHQNGDDLALESRYDDPVETGVTSEVPEEAHLAQ